MEGYIWKEALQDGVYQTESWDGQDKNSLEIEMKERDRNEKKKKRFTALLQPSFLALNKN